MTLRGFSCLTRGDCICLHYNNKKYYIDITEAKPQVGDLLEALSAPSRTHVDIATSAVSTACTDLHLRLQSAAQDAISVIETDCEVDFAPPLDYVEPQREERAPAAAAPTPADAAGEGPCMSATMTPCTAYARAVAAQMITEPRTGTPVIMKTPWAALQGQSHGITGTWYIRQLRAMTVRRPLILSAA